MPSQITHCKRLSCWQHCRSLGNGTSVCLNHRILGIAVLLVRQKKLFSLFVEKYQQHCFHLNLPVPCLDISCPFHHLVTMSYVWLYRDTTSIWSPKRPVPLHCLASTPMNSFCIHSVKKTPKMYYKVYLQKGQHGGGHDTNLIHIHCYLFLSQPAQRRRLCSCALARVHKCFDGLCTGILFFIYGWDTLTIASRRCNIFLHFFCSVSTHWVLSVSTALCSLNLISKVVCCSRQCKCSLDVISVAWLANRWQQKQYNFSLTGEYTIHDRKI